MNKQSLVLGVLLAVVPAPGFAQADRFRAIDRNGDGFVSSEEWYAQKLAPVPFTVVDLDGDGRISEGEFREWSSARGGSKAVGMTPADRFRAIDGNKDGVLSPGEWKDGTYSRTPFSAVDANRDGTISPREFSVWDQRRVPAVAEPAPPPGTAAPAMSERLRSLDRGAPGVAASPVVPPAPRTSPAPAPPSPATTTPSGGIPGSSPNMSSGSGLTTR